MLILNIVLPFLEWEIAVVESSAELHTPDISKFTHNNLKIARREFMLILQYLKIRGVKSIITASVDDKTAKLCQLLGFIKSDEIPTLPNIQALYYLEV